MSINQKQMYKMLTQQKQALESQLNPQPATVTEIPKDFNQKGWDLTIQAVRDMLADMEEASLNRGKRMTPQFFRAIFNRTVVARQDLEKMKQDIQLSTQADIDFSAENIRLNQEIVELHKQLAEKTDESQAEKS